MGGMSRQFENAMGFGLAMLTCGLLATYVVPGPGDKAHPNPLGFQPLAIAFVVGAIVGGIVWKVFYLIHLKQIEPPT